ncbi:2Fe-2S iron-sulfur cluster-binding protein [Streptomyces sp. NPDC088252]|uniref:2Fe-2S iron-sulfur cluster-binding protein n=1 Tax=unclassified Streptomyces TaxID=2593676 RepID=UPI00344A1E9C
MSNEEHNEQHGQRERPQHGGWQPTPQGGEYDAEATAFVHLPPEDLANIPLAAPGHGYVPPMIVPLTPAAGLDPAATGSWVVQPQGRQERGTGAEQPEPGAVHWPDPNQQPQYGYGYPQQEHYPGTPAATGQWNFTESAQAAGSTEFGGHADHSAHVDQGGHVGHGGHTGHGGVVGHGDHGGHGGATGHGDQGGPVGHGGHGDALGHGGHGDALGHGGSAGHINHSDHTGQSGPADHMGQSGHTGQWTIPVADGDLPEESGEFAASALASQWYADRTPPATLPGGAPAPWATQQPVAEPEVEAGPEPAVEPAPGADIEPQHAPEADSAPDAQLSTTPSAAPPETAPASPSATPTASSVASSATSSVAYGESPQVPGAASETPVAAAQDGPAPAAGDTPVLGVDLTQVPAADAAATVDVDGRPEQRPAEPSTGAAPDSEPGTTADTDSGTPLGGTPGEAPLPEAPPLEAQTSEAQTSEAHSAEARSPEEQISEVRSHEAEPPGTEPVEAQLLEAQPVEAPVEAPVEVQPLDVPSEHPATSYVLHVNGADRPVTDAWIGESLLYVLRERLGLAGAKDGCSQGECGACNVQVDGRLVASCLVPAATTAGSEVRTVEGLAVNGEPSDVQRALAKCGAVQCGFCIPGMAMTIHDLLEGNHAPSELETRQALCGNLCRCSGYRGVLDAVNEVIADREAGAGPASSDSPSPESDEARIPHQAAAGAGGVESHSQDGGMA